MEQNKNVVGWFEIPVTDMERAIKFYEEILGIILYRNQFGPLDMAWFQMDETGNGAPGSLVYYPDQYKPSADGVLIYFTSPSGDVSQELARVEKAGGKLLRPKTLISEDVGYMGLFFDTEGNKIAIHSRK
ncbi:MAG: glyoxalase [Bacteroides sp. SM23_62_1]|nr:MAG: glyoxalase [Bacteroides sp. SM23_62_1]